MTQPNKRINPPVSILLRRVPLELRNQFKAWCVARGMNMTQVITDYMYQCVTSDLKKTQEKRRPGRPRLDEQWQ